MDTKRARKMLEAIKEEVAKAKFSLSFDRSMDQVALKPPREGASLIDIDCKGRAVVSLISADFRVSFKASDLRKRREHLWHRFVSAFNRELAKCTVNVTLAGESYILEDLVAVDCSLDMPGMVHVQLHCQCLPAIDHYTVDWIALEDFLPEDALNRIDNSINWSESSEKPRRAERSEK